MRPKGLTRVCSDRMKETLGFSISAPSSLDSRPSPPFLPKLLKALNPLQQASKSRQFPWMSNLVDIQAWAIERSISSIFDLLRVLIFSISCLKKVIHFRSTSSAHILHFSNYLNHSISMAPQRRVTIDGSRGHGRKTARVGASNTASPSPLGHGIARASIHPLGFILCVRLNA